MDAESIVKALRLLGVEEYIVQVSEASVEQVRFSQTQRTSTAYGVSTLSPSWPRWAQGWCPHRFSSTW